MEKDEAEALFDDFPNNAYEIDMAKEYAEAACTLYGRCWQVDTDECGRMIFTCTLCHRSVNDTNGVANHARARKHLKVLDEPVVGNDDSLRNLLQKAVSKAIGLHMIEEYHYAGNYYYKCTLCGAHSLMIPMYHHILGTKHKDRYITKYSQSMRQQYTTAQREEWIKAIIDDEGVQIDEIMTIEGRNYFPRLWEANAKKKWRRGKDAVYHRSISLLSTSSDSASISFRKRLIEDDEDATESDVSMPGSRAETCISAVAQSNVRSNLNLSSSYASSDTSLKEDEETTSKEDSISSLSIVSGSECEMQTSKLGAQAVCDSTDTSKFTLEQLKEEHFKKLDEIIEKIKNDSLLSRSPQETCVSTDKSKVSLLHHKEETFKTACEIQERLKNYSPTNQ